MPFHWWDETAMIPLSSAIVPHSLDYYPLIAVMNPFLDVEMVPFLFFPNEGLAAMAFFLLLVTEPGKKRTAPDCPAPWWSSKRRAFRLYFIS